MSIEKGNKYKYKQQNKDQDQDQDIFNKFSTQITLNY